MSKILTIIFVILVFILGALFYIYNPDPIEYKIEKPVACTTEAMLCPDGSYVGRSGPKCEFKACPIPKDAILEDGTIDSPALE